jgi:predicted phosphohydrolase
MSLKLQYASDLHLEFPNNKEFLKLHPLQPVGNVLVLAGDIVPFAIMEKNKDFFNYVSDHFEFTYWLPGNHEYYRYDLFNKQGVINEAIRKNVFLVNNTSVVHQNTKLVFSTLWSKISEANQWQIEKSLNDFHVIKYNGHRFSANIYNKLFEESLAFIQQEIVAKKDEQIVVFTHHCPTYLHYPEQYKGDILNEAFATELFEFIESSNIKAWIYGHHHTNTPEFKIGNTQLLTNQLGYVQLNEHGLFETNKVIEI